MSNGFSNLYEFGSFRLDAETGTLWSGGDVVPLSPKAAELLKLLIERQGRIVSKQEIFDTVWANTFVEDGVLAQNIYTLRNTLGPDENGKQFIETVARRGYRFAGELRTAPEYRAANGQSIAADNLPGLEKADDFKPNMLVSPAPHAAGPQTLRRPFIIAFGVVLAVAVIWFGLYRLYFQRNGKEASKPAPIEQVKLQRLTDLGDVLYPTVSPDGELLAYVRTGEQEESVWVKQIATGSTVQTLAPSRRGYGSLAFSPDGRYLLFREDLEGGAIFQVPVLGGTPKKIIENVWTDFCLASDGSRIAFVRRDASRNADLLIIAGMDGAIEKELSVREAPLNYRSGPAWSPDGSKLVIAAGTGQEFPLSLLSIDPTNGSETELNTPKWRTISNLLWMPNGKDIVISAREVNEASSQLWMLGYPNGDARRLTNDLESYFWISRTADGQMLVTRQQRIAANLWLLPEGDMKKAKQITSGERRFDGYGGLAWTPEGKLVFSARSGQITDLYSIDADGTDMVQLTSNSGQDNTYPTLSADGRTIVFSSNRTGSTQIWRMETDGRNPRQLTFGSDQKERSQWPASSPNGEIFYLRRAGGTAEIWKVPIEGGTPSLVLRITNGSADGPLWISPEGKWLAYRHVPERPEPGGENRTQRIGIISLTGAGETKFFDLPMRRPMLQWTSENAFDFAAGTFNTSSLMRQTLVGGKPQKLVDFPDRVFNFAWSSDGKSLAVSRGQLRGDALLITNLP